MRVFALVMVLTLGAGWLSAQQPSPAAFGAAVKDSLDRARDAYPDSANPDSPLSHALLMRIEYLNRNNRLVFSDPDWPMKLTAAEAAAMGIPARPPTRASAAAGATAPGGRYLATVTRSFSVVGASFRKGQQIVIEELRDYKKRGIVLVEGQPVLIWLDHVKILRPLAARESTPRVVKIESARYGAPGQTGYPVSDTVQALITPNVSGQYEILVSDALLPPAAAQRLNRNATARNVYDAQTGLVVPAVTGKILTVTYNIDGVKRTRQAVEGKTLVLD